jgi:hypothetical protein
MVRLEISYALLEELLHLPDGAKVEDVGQDFSDRYKKIIQIVISHPDLPEALEGCLIPLVNPTWTLMNKGGRAFGIDWGLTD